MSIALLTAAASTRGDSYAAQSSAADTTQASHIEKSASTVKTGEAAELKVHHK